MNTHVRLLSYHAEMFLEWQMFQSCTENKNR